MAEQDGQRQQEGDPEGRLEVPEEVMDFYCDSVYLNTNVWGTTLYLGQIRQGKKPLLKARVKVSPQMLRALSLLTGKHVRDYERDIGPIVLPNSLIRSWGLEEELG